MTKTGTRRFSLGLDRFSGLYLWAVFIVLFSVLAPQTFPTASTVHLLAATQSIAAIVALALLMPMVTGQFDLSIGAIANLSGLAATVVQTAGLLDPIGALILGVVIGVVVGAINGFVVVKLHIDSFIATLAMGSILVAFQILITGNRDPIPVYDPRFTGIAQTPVLGFQMVFVYMLVIAVILWWVLERTPMGRYMRATGNDREAARLSGVQVDKWAWLSLIMSGGICGFAGVLFVALVGPSLSFGPSLLLPAFAAVFLGSTQLMPGRANVWGTVLSIFILATGVQGLQLISGAQWVASLFNGVALIVAVGLAVNRRRRIARADDVEAQDAPPPSPAAGEPSKERHSDEEVVAP